MENEIMEITIRIPLLMTKDGEDFLISCSPLSIYIKGESEENAKMKFEESIDHLFEKLIDKGTIVDYLSSKELIVNNNVLKKPVRRGVKRKPSFHMPDLTLGSHARLDVPLAVA